MGIMRRIWLISLLLLEIGTRPGVAEDKPTSLSDARAAVEANMRTAEGKAYDDKLGADFTEKHLAAIRPCKKAGGDDLRSFWILAKLNGENQSWRVFARSSPQGSISAAPHPAYWVSIYMKPSK